MFVAYLLQELRVEDYLANRKGPQQGGGAVGFSFGSSAVQQTQASGFGAFGQPNKPTTATFGGKTIVIKPLQCNSDKSAG